MILNLSYNFADTWKDDVKDGMNPVSSDQIPNLSLDWDIEKEERISVVEYNLSLFLKKWNKSGLLPSKHWDDFGPYNWDLLAEYRSECNQNTNMVNNIINKCKRSPLYKFQGKIVYEIMDHCFEFDETRTTKENHVLSISVLVQYRNHFDLYLACLTKQPLTGLYKAFNKYRGGNGFWYNFYFGCYRVYL